ncbi:MAG: DUF202 domain-containing protein [Hoeflea sp.]|uniref:DUF202 domain-containing protein n=1 Tax=Hoeflea sp. TaxID=1940281 RepID=UPI003EF5F56E
MSATDDKSSQELAEDRTDWAEDRTILANERTFAGWMRTGLAAVGIGLGFQAIFRAAEPTWAAKAAATIFIAIGIFIFYAAHRQSGKLLARLDAHTAEPAARGMLGLIAFLFSVGSAGLALIVWVLL